MLRVQVVHTPRHHDAHMIRPLVHLLHTSAELVRACARVGALGVGTESVGVLAEKLERVAAVR